jgi:hypothetical protein
MEFTRKNSGTKLMQDLADISAGFKLSGDYLSCTQYGSGHIHDTYLLVTSGDKESTRYILQRLNTFVFRKPEALQDNLFRILEFLHQDASNHPDDIIYPEIVESGDGNTYITDQWGNIWRCFKYIEETHALDLVENADQAYQGGRMFGLFCSHLKKYNARRLHITIPDFLNIEIRLQQLMIAQMADPSGRLKMASKEFENILDKQLISRDFIRLKQALPERVTHNDTKISNVLFSNKTGRGISVIDLDTVMTGTLLTDFGDMVRTFTSEGGEEETDMSKVNSDPRLFEGLVNGFMAGTGDFIADVEKANLLLGAKLMIYMQSVRFLTDFLNGDVYYKIAYPEQNLDRTKNQLKLLESILEQEEDFGRILKNKM